MVSPRRQPRPRRSAAQSWRPVRGGPKRAAAEALKRYHLAAHQGVARAALQRRRGDRNNDAFCCGARVRSWPETEARRCPRFGRDRVESRQNSDIVRRPSLTQCMVRPCVARVFVELAVSGLASMYPAFGWSGYSWPPWISARVRSHYATGLDRASWVTSVRMRREDRTSISSHPLADLGR